MNLLFPILLIFGNLIFDWEIAAILTRHVENECEPFNRLDDYVKFAISLILFLSGLYIFHRQKMISPYMPVKIYTFYTIAHFIIAFVCVMIPIGIEFAGQIIESIKYKQNRFSTLICELIEAQCIFVFADSIFFIPWILQRIGFF